MQVSVIIVNYNTCSDVLNCIRSVIDKTRNGDYEIIVVDNNSTDQSVEKIRSFFPSVRVIACADNLGFGRANNLASSEAKGEYLFFLNPDTILCNNAIEILQDFYESESYKRIGVLGGLLLDGNGNPRHSFDSIRHPLKAAGSHVLTFLKKIFALRRNPFKRIKPRYSGEQVVGYITGADLFIRRNIFERVGGFDEGFFMYFEDEELQYRLRRQKLKSVFVPDAKIVHYESTSSTSSNTKRIMLSVSHLKYIRKYYGVILKELYKMLMIISAVLEMPFDKRRRIYSISESAKYVRHVFFEMY